MVFLGGFKRRGKFLIWMADRIIGKGVIFLRANNFIIWRHETNDIVTHSFVRDEDELIYTPT
jgi:hypothetical protein